jgi:hypothetical protein
MVTSFAPMLTSREFIGGADEIARRDAEILAYWRVFAPKGLGTALDLGGCNPRAIRDAGQLERFVIALCDVIAQRRLGDPIIVRLGDNPWASGYSLAQSIETALISGHFDEHSDHASIDIFSRKPYPPYRAAEFCRRWFGAATVRVSIAPRQAEGDNLDTIACS